MRFAFLLLVLVGCRTSQTHPFPLPSGEVAGQLGPQAETGTRPKIFVAGKVEDAVLMELAPYHGAELTVVGSGGDDKFASEATVGLVADRPDAIYVIPTRGVPKDASAGPFEVANAAGRRTNAVAYAMRAMRVALPFRYNLRTGTVTEIMDRSAVPGLLEGDVVTKIADVDALPPKLWSLWPLYPLLLSHAPGDELPLECVRAGTGKVSCKAKLIAPMRTHLKTPDSVDTTYMPRIEVVEQDGKTTWRMPKQPWKPDAGGDGWVPEPR